MHQYLSPLQGLVIAGLMLGLAAGCDSSSSRGPVVDQEAPVITEIPAQTTTVNTDVAPITIEVTDNSQGAVTVRAQSDNPVVVDADGLTLTTDSDNRILRITPNSDAIGTAGISIAATDSAGNQTTISFQLAVEPENLTADAVVGRIVNLPANAEPVNLNVIRITGELSPTLLDSRFDIN